VVTRAAVVIRPAEAGDREGLRELLAPGWLAGRDACLVFVDRVIDQLAEVDRRVLVAEAEEGVVGWGRAASWAPSPEDPANAAPGGVYLRGVSVIPSWRRRGIGRRLTQARLDWARGRGAREAYYFADQGNVASLALHAPFGFRIVTHDFWFPGIHDPDVPMFLLRAPLPSGAT